MLYKLIIDPYELKSELIKYEKDCYTLTEYQAILDYFETNDLIELNIPNICRTFIKSSWEQLYKEWGNHKHENIINALSHITHVLTWDDNWVLYIAY